VGAWLGAPRSARARYDAERSRDSERHVRQKEEGMSGSRSRTAWHLVRGITAVALAVGSTLALATNAFANVALTKVSHDPYTNTNAYHSTQVEPDTFAWGNTIVAVFQTGRFPGGGSDDTGFATSTDRGKTWTHGFMPGTTIYADPPGQYGAI